jgi:hypothetical protein
MDTETKSAMSFAMAVASLGSKVTALKEKARELIGEDGLDRIEACANQQPIEAYLKKFGLQEYITVHPVDREQGVRIVILSSVVYPEFGLLVFDCPVGHDGSGIYIRFEKAREHKDPRFQVVCGCCWPYRAGMPASHPVPDEQQHTEFIATVVRTCKRFGITTLCCECLPDLLRVGLSMQTPESGVLVDGVRLVNLYGDRKNDEHIDRKRFIAAYRDLHIGDKSDQFDGIFSRSRS